VNNPPALLKFRIYPADSRLWTLQRAARRGKTALPMTEEAARTELSRTIIEKAARPSVNRIRELPNRGAANAVIGFQSLDTLSVYAGRKTFVNGILL